MFPFLCLNLLFDLYATFLQALSHENGVVAYEVVLNLQRLVNKYGKDLQHVTWETVLDILESLLTQIEVYGIVSHHKNGPCFIKVSQRLESHLSLISISSTAHSVLSFSASVYHCKAATGCDVRHQ